MHRDLEAMLSELQRLQPPPESSSLASGSDRPVGATPIVIASRPGMSLETPRVRVIQQKTLLSES